MWHTLSIGDTLRKLGSNISTGLNSKEVEKRFNTYGKNKLNEKKINLSFFCINFNFIFIKLSKKEPLNVALFKIFILIPICIYIEATF